MDTTKELTDQAAWEVILELQPGMAAAIEILVNEGVTPKRIAHSMQEQGASDFLVALIESAAQYIGREKTQ